MSVKYGKEDEQQLVGRVNKKQDGKIVAQDNYGVSDDTTSLQPVCKNQQNYF